jgi:virginiamycin B lyase
MEHRGVPFRRILLILLTAALVVPVGMFVRHEWQKGHVCKREFGSEAETEDYEICMTYGANPDVVCADLERNLFRCSEDFIAGHRMLVAARHAGLFQARVDCAAANQSSLGTQCSPEQWDRYCSTYHGARRALGRCRAAGPVGPEGVPPAELQAKLSAPVGPLSGPRTECGTLTAYEQPGIDPGSVAADADGSVWFTEPAIGAISHMAATGKITRQFLWTRPGLLARTASGDLLFATRDAIWQRSPTGETRRHAIPAAAPTGPTGGGLSDMTVSADGSVWFLQSDADRLGRLSPDGTITDVPLARPGDGFIRPSSLTADPDGSVWVSATLAGRIARVDGRTLAVAQFPIPHATGVVKGASLAADGDGGVWFEYPATSVYPEGSPPALGRMNRRGSITFHRLPDGQPRWPGSLTAGPDGAIWFLDGPAKTVGRMASDGTLTGFPFAYADVAVGGTRPHELAAGPSALWFAQPHTNSLGLITCQGAR